MSRFKNRLAYQYSPSVVGSLSTFNGVPCPTQAAYSLIGKEGIDQISSILTNVVHSRMAIHGPWDLSDYGLATMQTFIHYPTRQVIKASDILTILGLKPFSKEEKNRKHNSGIVEDALHDMQHSEDDHSLQKPSILSEKNFYIVRLTGKQSGFSKREIRKLIELQRKVINPFP